MKMKREQMPGVVHVLLALALLALISAIPARAYSQEGSTAQSTPQTSEPKQERTEKLEEQEENASLKHAKPVQWLARKINWSVHGAHLLLSGLNFAIIVGIVFWAVRKFVPGVLRNRSASIQGALEEARAASQDASRRLAEIENRLRQLDVEIGHMQATAEKEGDAEEVRIQRAAEEDMRKVVVAAEQEIATAAKQARRELTTHTADLALALARRQINVDSNTDRVLVRTFAAKLAAPDSHKPAPRKDKDDDGGKDGR